MIPVLTPLQCRDWDAAAVVAGRPLRMLMENAGRAVARLALSRCGVAAAQGTLVACGSGNNGGDGWVAARALHLLGIPIWVTETAAPDPGIAADARRAALEDGVRTVAPDGPWPGIGLVIDALLGTGAQGIPREPISSLLARIRELDRPVIAVDGPSGLDLATGVDHGALPAVLTVTFGAARRGHLLARDTIGELVISEIGLPPAEPGWPRLVTTAWAADRLIPMRAAAHKGERGRVVIIGGSSGMTGAARMSARAAFAAGAGLVHVVAPPDAVAELRVAEPDVQTLTHSFDLPLDAPLTDLLQRADAVVIGPGLGRAPASTAFVLSVLERCPRVVMDADALWSLRGELDRVRDVATTRTVVMTPHVGEYRRLFPESGDTLETDPWSATEAAALRSGTTLLLKGVPTVIAAPGAAMLTVAAGNPGLATGGSGDVLSGVVGAFLAQGMRGIDAAATAAQALGEAADIGAARGTPRTLRPTDVIESFDAVWQRWAQWNGRAPSLDLLELPAPVTT